MHDTTLGVSHLCAYGVIRWPKSASWVRRHEAQSVRLVDNLLEAVVSEIIPGFTLAGVFFFVGWESFSLCSVGYLSVSPCTLLTECVCFLYNTHNEAYDVRIQQK